MAVETFHGSLHHWGTPSNGTIPDSSHFEHMVSAVLIIFLALVLFLASLPHIITFFRKHRSGHLPAAAAESNDVSRTNYRAPVRNLYTEL